MKKASQKTTGQKKGRDDTLAPENVEVETGRELRDEKITDKFGAPNTIPINFHVLC